MVSFAIKVKCGIPLPFVIKYNQNKFQAGDAMNTAIKMDELIKRLFHLSKKPLLNLLNALYNDNIKETTGVEYGGAEFVHDNLVKSM
ncbi:MAG TPA: hypothetical protein DHV84_05665 [Desulfotomaculum sp.]|jgi:hypothetical protein|nr:hypothetical protein [Desulfotomaculum sp.]